MTDYVNANELEWNQNTSAERRQGERRTGTERREMIRFETDKVNRRTHERRQTATSWGGSKPV